jgi:hypothetical protein
MYSVPTEYSQVYNETISLRNPRLAIQLHAAYSRVVLEKADGSSSGQYILLLFEPEV